MSDIQSLIPGDLIGSQLTIKLNTKPEFRELVGILLALDNKPNLLLNNVIEVTKDADGEKVISKRELGLVSVPMNTIGDVRVNTAELEKIIGCKRMVV